MNYSLTKLTSLKSVEDFRRHVLSLEIDLEIDAEMVELAENPLMKPIKWGERTIGNRIAIQPMEGWDGTSEGTPTEATIRRWRRFGESGAKLIWGGEAMAVRPDGRANPHQLMLLKENASSIEQIASELRKRHLELYAESNDLVIGFQLTHSGRFCRPHEKQRWEPRVAYRHPLLDERFGVVSDDQLWSDTELDDLVGDYVASAKIAERCGADFVDIKCCHGYLLHEFLGARTRQGRYGGSFENRSRLLINIVRAIQQAAPGMGIGVRLSAFDSVPFVPDPDTETQGKKGQGTPIDYSHLIPYLWGFGINASNPLQYDLTEVFSLIRLLESYGVGLINVSAGSPYYTPHILRPAAYPPSDGYQPHEDPLRSVAKQTQVAATLKTLFPSMLMVGSGYSYLQEFLPLVAQHQVRNGLIDFVGLGRMVLSYPTQMIDSVRGRVSQRKLVCRTFSDCTTAPRNGLASGCYPLDEYYKKSPEAFQLKGIKDASE